MAEASWRFRGNMGPTGQVADEVNHAPIRPLAGGPNLLPTICDLTGVPTPENIDGRSLVGVVGGRPDVVRFCAY